MRYLFVIGFILLFAFSIILYIGSPMNVSGDSKISVTVPKNPIPPDFIPKSTTKNTLVASWDGPRYHGRRTASGVRFNMFEASLAHKKWPFGTRVRLRNPLNGEEIVVEVNDRGPYWPHRDLDLSWKAAHLLGMVRDGVVPLEYEILSSQP